MTHTDPDALIAELAASPDPDGTLVVATVDSLIEADRWTADEVTRLVQTHPQDGVRLLSAEWFERLPPVKCKRCKGKGYYSYNGAEFGYTVDDCEDCGKKGTVPDPGNAARAELIRVQVELGRTPDCDPYPTGQCPCRRCKLQSRERAILEAHSRRWETLPCVACGATGWVPTKRPIYTPGQRDSCPVCSDPESDTHNVGGSRDLLIRKDISVEVMGDPSPRRTVHWDRGWPVVECALGEVVREVPGRTCHWCKGTGNADGHANTICVCCGGRGATETRTVPTPWAAAVAKVCVGLRVVDWPIVAVGNGFCVPYNDDGRTLPEPVANAMYRGQVPRVYPTRDAAVQALAWAVAGWARGQGS